MPLLVHQLKPLLGQLVQQGKQQVLLMYMPMLVGILKPLLAVGAGYEYGYRAAHTYATTSGYPTGS